MLDVRSPMENGIVRDWQHMRHVWNYTFYEKLKIDPTTTKVRREQIANLCPHQLVTDPADGRGDEPQAEPNAACARDVQDIPLQGRERRRACCASLYAQGLGVCGIRIITEFGQVS